MFGSFFFFLGFLACVMCVLSVLGTLKNPKRQSPCLNRMELSFGRRLKNERRMRSFDYDKSSNLNVQKMCKNYWEENLGSIMC